MASLLDGYFSLGGKANKVNPQAAETEEGVVDELLPELRLDMDDDELILLSRDWKAKWEKENGDLTKAQNENEQYWLGKQFDGTPEAQLKRPLMDNAIFQAVETFLPIATRQNPDPVIEGPSEAQPYADALRKMVSFQVDRLRVKLKLKKTLRFWSTYFVGVMKVGWDLGEDDITCQVLRPQVLILDNDAAIDESGHYLGEYIGEYRKETAENLIKRFPKSKVFITQYVKDKLGTEVRYIEWWTDTFSFWTLESHVLGKVKNPHWNYESTEPTVDEMGQVTEKQVPGRNHFRMPKKPYIFLSVFNLGLHPYDDANLIKQNLSMQDLVNKRLRQIDRNADNTNGTLKISGDAFSQEQAADVADAFRKGRPIWVPTGSVDASVKFDSAGALPNFLYQSLVDYRSELANVFGTRGSTPSGIASEETVRGKIISREQDSSRIGGMITEYLEQFCDNLYNWFVQLMYVYYDEPHTAVVLGAERAREMVQISASEIGRYRFTVSVKEGSMIPKDPLTKRNEAIDLWTAGALDPITLFDRLEFSNPRESAKQLFIWKTAPQMLFPDLMPQQQMTAPQPRPGAPAGGAEISGDVQPEQPAPALSQVPIQ